MKKHMCKTGLQGKEFGNTHACVLPSMGLTRCTVFLNLVSERDADL